MRLLSQWAVYILCKLGILEQITKFAITKEFQ